MAGKVILQDNGRWLTFENPMRVVTAVTPAEVLPALGNVETAVNQDGLFAAGYVAYEAGAAFDLAVYPPKKGAPLLWFGLYKAPVAGGALPSACYQLSPSRYQLSPWRAAIHQARYQEAIAQIKDEIARGHTYQVNYTFTLRAEFSGEPWGLFADLAENQHAETMAYLDTGRHVICSASPELFFRLEGDFLTSKPMKGTADRGRTLAEDRTNMEWLRHSEKNRAENVMIVDMIRNDMGRVAEIGSVQAARLFEVERYPTLLQMTSTVTARTPASLADIMTAMFPCASITGAPKRRTMEIIRDLEPGPRGVYTGAVGFLGPGRQAQFNVAIRTVVIDRKTGMAEFGVGSGIVWDSDAKAEFRECRLKTDVLKRRRADFALLESLLWRPEKGYFLLEAHMSRLLASAEYFEFRVEETAVRDQLEQATRALTEPAKVRLLVEKDGRVHLETLPLSNGLLPEPVRVGLAKAPVDSNEVFLYHKTTVREVYRAACAGRPDCDEVLLWNERGELTEASRSNIVVELDGRLLTPPVSSGLLAGTFRAHLLSQGKVEAQALTLEDLSRCRKIWLVNSVRGWQQAAVVKKTGNPSTG